MVLMRVLHLLSSFGYNGAAKESSLLARGLATDCDLRVCVLQEEGPWRWTLREVGVELGQSHCESLNFARLSSGLDTPIRPPADAGRRIVCVGSLHANKGFRAALRAADFLAYPFAGLQFHIIGAGPYLPALERFQE